MSASVIILGDDEDETSTPVIILSDDESEISTPAIIISDDDDEETSTPVIVLSDDDGGDDEESETTAPHVKTRGGDVGQLAALIRVAKETDSKRGLSDVSAAPVLYQWHTRVISAARQLRGSAEIATAARIDLPYENGALHGSDLRTLTHGKWLNDEIINCYLELVAASCGRSSSAPRSSRRCLAMTTFFYTALTGRGYDYKRVQKWTRGVDTLAAFDLILFPIHRVCHWTLAVADVRKRKLTYYDSLGRNEGGGQVCKHLSRWLRDEAESNAARAAEQEVEAAVIKAEEKEQEKGKKLKAGKAAWQINYQRGIPLQKNGSDCGVFVCKYAECVAFDIPFNFSQKDMPRIRDAMIYELLANTLL